MTYGKGAPSHTTAKKQSAELRKNSIQDNPHPERPTTTMTQDITARNRDPVTSDQDYQVHNHYPKCVSEVDLQTSDICPYMCVMS